MTEGQNPAPRHTEAKAPLGLMIRLAIYLFAGHIFAAFLYLLFSLGAGR